MRLSDAGLRRSKTKPHYLDHRPSPCAHRSRGPRSLQPLVWRIFLAAPQRSSFRMTNFKPDHTSVTAQTFTSTKPRGKATARIVSSVMSVGTFEDFFGHEIHTTAL